MTSLHDQIHDQIHRAARVATARITEGGLELIAIGEAGGEVDHDGSVLLTARFRVRADDIAALQAAEHEANTMPYERVTTPRDAVVVDVEDR